MVSEQRSQTTQHLEHLERLLEIGRELTSTKSLEALLHLIVEAAIELTQTESAAILLSNENGTTLHFSAVTSYGEQLMTIAVPVENSIAGAAFTSGQPVIVSDVNKDPRYFSDAEQQTGFVARSLLALPLKNNNYPIGVLEVENKKNDSPFNEEDINILTSLAAQATIAIENTRLTNNLEEMVQQRTKDLETAVLQLQQEIKQHNLTTAALTSAEERWRTLVSHAPVHIVTINQEGTILFANKISETRSHAQVINSSVYTYLPTKAKIATQKVLASVFKTGKPQKYESCIKKDNGETDIWYENHVAPLYQDGKIVSAIFISTDITHRKKAEKLLLEQQIKLAAMKERQRIAHDLHDGLGQVMGYINMQLQTALELLNKERPIQLQTLLQKLINVTQNSQTDIRNSIQKIRSQAESNHSFSTALQTLVDAYQQQYDVKVKSSLPHDLPTRPFAPVVEDQILSIIQEALTNIYKHAQTKEARLLLLLSSEQAQIIVEDEGIGFDLTKQDKLEKNKLNFGLQIMAQRIEEIGGELQIRTAPGKGTQIIIQIARWPESNIEALRSMRILLVDDHPLFLEGLQDRLITKGISVIGVAHDGLEAQTLALSLRPDLILMDINMPKCDGITATRHIKSALNDVKIAMLTVAGNDDTLFSALKYGADGYLLKDMSGDIFLEQLSALARGEIVIAPELARKILTEFITLKEQTLTIKPQSPREEESQLDLLTSRQQKILGLVAKGLTYKEVGTQLHLSESAIKYHMGNILKQLHLNKRTEAIFLAKKTGLDKVP